MLKDLDAREVLKGVHREDVVGILGPPDYSAPDGSYLDYVLRESRPKDRMLYAVVWLHVRLDSQGVVVGYGVRRE
jgi:hypothetical protein